MTSLGIDTDASTVTSTMDNITEDPLQHGMKRMFGPLPGIMSNELFNIFVLVFGIIVIFLISSLGTVLNIFNIMVFYKQGLKDTVNITLLGLAVSDLGSVITLLLMSAAYVLHFFPNAIRGIEIRYMAGFLNWPHAAIVRVACLQTVFVAFERCMCVVIPLHVHRILTPGLAKFYNVFILTFLLAIFVSLYNYSVVGPLFLPHINRTILGINFTPEGRRYSIYMSYIVGFIYVASFFLVAALTFTTIIKLNKQAKWRQKTASAASTTTGSNSDGSKKEDAVSMKTRRVVKMVVVICVIFIACTAPGLINTVLYVVFPEYKQMRRYENMYTGTSMINFALEAVNSTLNFFIYYHMSSNFATTFDIMMGRQTKKDLKASNSSTAN